MSFIGNAIGSVLGGITGANQAAKGAQQAAQTQASAAQSAIAEQRAGRDQSIALQQPYVDAGTRALTQQMSLIGLDGTEGQQTALNGLISSPQYTTGVRQGEEAILQNASATGGLRGGNTQNSLANFRADLLSSLFDQQYQRVAGLAGLGQNAATGVGNTIGSAANNVSTLLGEQASALAGGQIAKGNATTNAIGGALNLAGSLADTFKTVKGLGSPSVAIPQTPRGF